MGNRLIEMFGVSLGLTIAVELIAVSAVSLLYNRKSCGFEQSRGGSVEDAKRILRKEAQHPFLPAIHGRNGILLVILVNVLTNPAAVLLCLLGRWYMPGVAQLLVQLLTEAAVITAEAWIYVVFSKDERWKIVHPVMLSVLANLCSWLTGVILMAVRR